MASNSNNNNAYNGFKEITANELILKIREWFGYLLSKWLVILISAVLAGVTGLTYALYKKPTYIAELSFVVQDDKSSGGASGLASQFGIDLGGGGNAGGEFTGDNLLELIKSRSMITKALLTPVVVDNKRITLAEYYIEFNNLRKDWAGKPEFENIHFLPGDTTFTLKQNSVLGAFRNKLIKTNLNVEKKDKKLSIITVTVKSTSELFSKYFTEILVKRVSDFYIETKTEKEVKNVGILQKQTDSVRRILNGGLSGIAESIDVNPNPNPARQILHVSSQRKQIEVGINQTILNELIKNLEIAKLSLLKETPLTQIIDRPILPLEKDEVGKTIGLIIAGIIGGVIAIIYLILKKMFSNS